MRFLAAALLVAAVACASASYVNKDVQRSIDLTTHTPRISVQITAKGSGAYELVFPAETASHIAWIEASDDNGEDLAVSKPSAGSKKDTTSYKLTPPSGGKSFTVNYVLTHSLHPLPKKIAQADQQTVIYHDSHFFFSGYETETQKTEIKLASSTIEDRSDEKPSIVKGDLIVYGPYEKKPAYAASPLRVHFVHNNPFFAVTTLTKEIEVSFWGNVAVEEHYDLRHTGAELKGFFSRLDMQRSPQTNAISSIRSVKAELPPHAADVYYRDVIGNISTSHVRETETGPEFEIIPRFPLFGGWKTQFYFGYNLPLNKYVSVNGDTGRYHLNITYGSPLSDVVVDTHTVKIILPEGSSNFKVEAPFDAGVQTQEIRYTYLDRVGRPVIVLTKHNVISDHDVFFQVTFDFSGVWIYHEPLLLIVGFFALFALFILRTRVFEGSSDSNEAKIARFHDIALTRAALRRKVDALWAKHLSGETDASTYQAKYRSLKAELAEAAAEARELETVAEIRAFNKDEIALDDSRALVFDNASIARPADEAAIKRFQAKADSLARRR